MTPEDYWRECVEIAAEECDAKLTGEQLAYISNAVCGAHENYGMAFYSPPASDRLNEIERESNTRLARLQAEFDTYRKDAETAVKQALRQHSDANISIGKHGEVVRYGGRFVRIQ